MSALAKCPPEATVYCYKCKANRQVGQITTRGLTSDNNLRETQGKTICGHSFNVMTTLATLAIMREWRPVDSRAK